MWPRPNARSGVKLFERSAAGVKPTPAGQRYYKRCIEAVGQLANANEEVRGFAARVSGDLRIGLIPTVTRAALAPTLDAVHVALSRRAAAHRRGLQRLAHRHGAERTSSTSPWCRRPRAASA